MKCIINQDKKCYVCGATTVHLHHVFGGRNRLVSERNGFTVWLCPKHHNMSNEGVHFNPELDRQIKRDCQTEYEKSHSHEEFMRLIGKNYKE